MTRAFSNSGRPAALLALFLAACHKEAPPPASAGETAIHVETTTVAVRVVPREVLLTGVLDADQRTDLSANATGRVMKVFVELGDTVAAGAKIAQLDARSANISQREAAANVKTATEQLASSKRDCDRYQGLLAKGAVTQQEYDRAIGQCQTQAASELAARARAAQAGEVIGDATIRAPFAGKIADRMIHVGDYVRPDSKVVTLLADNPLRVRLTVPERDLFAAKEGVTIRFETIGLPNRSFSATLKNIGREVRAQTRDLVVEAIADNKTGELIPGMFVTAHLPIGQDKQPVIPKTALVTADAQPSVFVVAGNRLQHRVVQVGAPLGGDVAIEDGLKENERIVVKPSSATVDGALVN